MGAVLDTPVFCETSNTYTRSSDTAAAQNVPATRSRSSRERDRERERERGGRGHTHTHSAFLMQDNVVCGSLTLLSCVRQASILPRTIPGGRAAAECKDWECLRLVHTCGFEFYDEVWQWAAYRGNLDCLAFALSHGYWLGDDVLERAAGSGQVACVDLLIEHGLPRKRPYMYFNKHTLPHEIKCLELMFNKGVPIDPASLIAAAAYGDVDFVRWLHKRGVPLWQHIETCAPPLNVMLNDEDRWWEEIAHALGKPRTLPAPAGLEVEDMWGALRYGSVYGAPVTPFAKEIFEEKRRRSRAVLLCFNAATRLSRACTSPKERHVWASMAALPKDLIKDILIFAELEIAETVMCRPLAGALQPPAPALEGKGV